MQNPRFLLVQGRALEQTEDSMQYFPSEWEREFPLIRKSGFDGIEWIYDKKSESNNPILTETGRKHMVETSHRYQVELENIVLDWFITHPLFVEEQFKIEKKMDKLISLIEMSSKAGFRHIILPLLEDNEIVTLEKQTKFVYEFNKKIAKCLDQYNIELHLETNLKPEVEQRIISSLQHNKVKSCFDMGNSASYGYSPRISIITMKDFLGSVHIKDRKNNGGPSVPLGEGSVNFHEAFGTLKNIGFNGPFSLQVYRNKSSDNMTVLKNSLTFINNIIDQVYR